MRVLVTGGTGLVGKATVDHLLKMGHEVRLLSRHADDDARQWAEGVEPYSCDVSDEGQVRGACERCDAVVHAAGVVSEDPPEVTFERVNVEGTRRLAAEAARAGVRRFVYVSSLGAEGGASDYHRSKKAAEDAVRAHAPAGWLICRPGNVYGPGDEVISLLLKLVRTLPVVPLIGRGDQPFQPVWHEDLGLALARAVERGDPRETVLEMAGPEVTTTREVVELLEKLTGKRTLHLPIPQAVARLGASAAEALGVDVRVTDDQITMLLEENVVPPGRANALTDVFGVTPLTLAEGVGRLVDEMPERLPHEGTGKLERQRYWADIRGSALDADALFELFRHEFYTLPPSGLLEVGVEPGTPQVLEVGNTMTMALPLRGNIQVRVVDISGRAATCVTLRGHPLSGAIRFVVEEPAAGVVRFEIRSFTRPSDLVDLIGMRTFGKLAQKATWRSVVQTLVERSGGRADEGVREENTTLEGADAEDVERWVEELVMRKKRDDAPKQGEEVGGSSEASGRAA
jgi:nucleoside-diphosphate-sugar epimerase